MIEKRCHLLYVSQRTEANNVQEIPANQSTEHE